MAVTVVKKPKAAAKKAKAITFTIDCSKPVDDKIMEISSFEKFLEQKIKVRVEHSSRAVDGCCCSSPPPVVLCRQPSWRLHASSVLLLRFEVDLSGHNAGDCL